MDTNLPIYMEDVPQYRICGNNMHIRWRTLELVMPVGVMLTGMEAAKEAIDEWRIEQSGKIEQLQHWRDHAASS